MPIRQGNTGVHGYYKNKGSGARAMVMWPQTLSLPAEDPGLFKDTRILNDSD